MRTDLSKIVAALTIAAALALPSAASALTPAQAQKDVEGELTRTYGSTWLERAPSWSVPECEEPQAPGDYQCMTEFEHAGTWYLVSATVSDGATELVYERHWVRRWGPNSNHCAKGTTVAGYLSSNASDCAELLLYQNFGYARGSRHPTVRYTGFKRHLYFYGTGTALWPDFFGYACQRPGKTYQCFNRFGDGFRWRPAS